MCDLLLRKELSICVIFQQRFLTRTGTAERQGLLVNYSICKYKILCIPSGWLSANTSWFHLTCFVSSLFSLCCFSVPSIVRSFPPPSHQIVLYATGSVISGISLLNRLEGLQTDTGWWRLLPWGEARPDLVGVAVPLHGCFHQAVLRLGSESRLELNVNHDKATLTSTAEGKDRTPYSLRLLLNLLMPSVTELDLGTEGNGPDRRKSMLHYLWGYVMIWEAQNGSSYGKFYTRK